MGSVTTSSASGSNGAVTPSAPVPIITYNNIKRTETTAYDAHNKPPASSSTSSSITPTIKMSVPTYTKVSGETKAPPALTKVKIIFSGKKVRPHLASNTLLLTHGESYPLRTVGFSLTPGPSNLGFTDMRVYTNGGNLELSVGKAFRNRGECVAYARIGRANIPSRLIQFHLNVYQGSTLVKFYPIPQLKAFCVSACRVALPSKSLQSQFPPLETDSASISFEVSISTAFTSPSSKHTFRLVASALTQEDINNLLGTVPPPRYKCYRNKQSREKLNRPGVGSGGSLRSSGSNSSIDDVDDDEDYYDDDDDDEDYDMEMMKDEDAELFPLAAPAPQPVSDILGPAPTERPLLEDKEPPVFPSPPSPPAIAAPAPAPAPVSPPPTVLMTALAEALGLTDVNGIDHSTPSGSSLMTDEELLDDDELGAMGADACDLLSLSTGTLETLKEGTDSASASAPTPAPAPLPSKKRKHKVAVHTALEIGQKRPTNNSAAAAIDSSDNNNNNNTKRSKAVSFASGSSGTEEPCVTSHQHQFQDTSIASLQDQMKEMVRHHQDMQRELQRQHEELQKQLQRQQEEIHKQIQQQQAEMRKKIEQALMEDQAKKALEDSNSACLNSWIECMNRGYETKLQSIIQSFDKLHWSEAEKKLRTFEREKPRGLTLMTLTFKDKSYLQLRVSRDMEHLKWTFRNANGEKFHSNNLPLGQSDYGVQFDASKYFGEFVGKIKEADKGDRKCDFRVMIMCFRGMTDMFGALLLLYVAGPDLHKFFALKEEDLHPKDVLQMHELLRQLDGMRPLCHCCSIIKCPTFGQLNTSQYMKVCGSAFIAKELDLASTLHALWQHAVCVSDNLITEGYRLDKKPLIERCSVLPVAWLTKPLGHTIHWPNGNAVVTPLRKLQLEYQRSVVAALLEPYGILLPTSRGGQPRKDKGPVIEVCADDDSDEDMIFEDLPDDNGSSSSSSSSDVSEEDDDEDDDKPFVQKRPRPSSSSSSSNDSGDDGGHSLPPAKKQRTH